MSPETNADVMQGDGQKDSGWSDDELDFEEEENAAENNKIEEEQWDEIDEIQVDERCAPAVTKASSRTDDSYIDKLHSTTATQSTNPPTPSLETLHQYPAPKVTSKPLVPFQHKITSNNMAPTRTFEEEFTIALKEKMEAEAREMKQTGRMKRWKPLREDPILRQRLMEAMISQLDRETFF